MVEPTITMTSRGLSEKEEKRRKLIEELKALDEC